MPRYAGLHSGGDAKNKAEKLENAVNEREMATPTVKVVKSKRKGFLFSVDDFLYVKDKASGDPVYCRCLRKETVACSPRLVLRKVFDS